MKKKLISIILTCAMIMGVTACGGKDPAADAQPAGDAATEAETEAQPEASAADPGVIYMNQAPTEFFEYPWWNCGTQAFNKLLFESLIGMDEKQQATTETGMAESYEMSEDGLTLTLTMRDGLKWHDGEEVTPDDVLWSMKTIIAGEAITINPLLKDVMLSIEGAENVKSAADELSGVTVDGRNMTIKFGKIHPNALLGMSMFQILPEHLLKDADLAQFQQNPFWQAPIGSGPFKLESSKMGEYANFVPFEEYWNGVASFDIYCSSSSIDADPNLVTNAKAGKVDYAYTKSYADVQALESVEGINVHSVPVLYTRFLKFNMFNKDANTESLLKDVRVRQAFAYALDKALICEQVFGGSADPGDGTSTPTGSEWKSADIEKYEYNPEKAKELLKEAGWDSSKVLTVGYYYTDQATADLMAIMQQMLAQVGINIEPKLIEGDLGTLLNAQPSSKDEKGISEVQWDVLYGALAATSPHDYYTREHSVNGSNNTTIADPEYDKLIEKLVSTADIDEQKKAYAELEKYSSEKMYEMAVYYQPIWVVTSDRVDSNVETWGNPQFSWNWNVQNWEIK